MAPKKEKGGTVSNSSKIWEPSLIGAHFNQVSSEPRKSFPTPAVPELRQSLQTALPGAPSLPDAPSPLPKTVLDPALPRRIAPPTKDPGSHQRRMSVEGRRKGTPGESVRFQSVEKAEWWGTDMTPQDPFRPSRPDGTPNYTGAVFKNFSLPPDFSWRTGILLIHP